MELLSLALMYEMPAVVISAIWPTLPSVEYFGMMMQLLGYSASLKRS